MPSTVDSPFSKKAPSPVKARRGNSKKGEMREDNTLPLRTSPRRKSSRNERASIDKGARNTKSISIVKKEKPASSIKKNLYSKLEAHVRDGEIFVHSPLLLTGKIYPNGPPEKFIGHYFRYVVSSYSTTTKKFELTYECQTIQEDGLSFEIDEGGIHETMLHVRVAIVRKGVDLFEKAITRINAHTREHQSVVLKSLQPKLEKCIIASEVDLSDIDAAAEMDPTKGWMSEEVVKARVYLSLFHIHFSIHWCTNVQFTPRTIFKARVFFNRGPFKSNTFRVGYPPVEAPPFALHFYSS